MVDTRGDLTVQNRVWDVFVSHASEDKDDVARPLAEALRASHLEVWFDEFTLRAGDSLRRSIDQGLRGARFGVVVLSPAFFRKEWAMKELDALASREAEGRKVILPVWHEIDAATVARYSPMLAGRYALRSNSGLDVVVESLVQVIRPSSEPLVEEEAWLKAALTFFDVENESAKKRWLFHLGAAERAGRISVRIEGSTHYEAADRLCRLGALQESPGSHGSHRFFEMTHSGRILFEALRPRTGVNADDVA